MCKSFWKHSITFDGVQMIMNINAQYIMGKINQNLFRHVISKNAAKLLTQSSKLMRLIYIDDFDSTEITNSLPSLFHQKLYFALPLLFLYFKVAKWSKLECEIEKVCSFWNSSNGDADFMMCLHCTK